MTQRVIYIDKGEGDESIFDLLPFVKRVTKFEPAAPIIERQTAETGTRDGITQTAKEIRYKERNVKISFFIDISRPENFGMAISSIYRVFVSEEPYYITDSYSPSRRWKVICDEPETIEKDGPNNWKEVTLTVTSIHGLAESKYTTEYPVNLSGEQWYFGMGVPKIDELPYEFDKFSFDVYNIGDTRIRPTDKDYQVQLWLSGKKPKITNKTTGESLTINRALTMDDEIEIIRQYVLVNDTPGVDVTGRWPSLVPGYNHFYISGVSEAKVKFITRFYYL